MNIKNKNTLLEKRTDEELMKEVAKGNIDMLRFLFERHNKHVYNFLLKMCGNKILSEDITQEVFYKMIKYRTSYNNGKFVSWMFTIAANSLSSYNNEKLKEYKGIHELTNFLSETNVEVKENYSNLHEALKKLSPNDREILILNRLQGIKHNELAEIVNSTPGAVKTRVSRAMEKLRLIYFEIYI